MFFYIHHYHFYSYYCNTNNTNNRFSEWPEEALQSVAKTYLADVQELDNDTILQGIVMVCGHIHQSVVQSSLQMKSVLNRMNYVTPTGYLELLKTFAKILGVKKRDLMMQRNRTAYGLDKLLTTAKEVAILQEQLTAMQPQLKEAAIETEATMKKIATDKIVAEETAVVVGKEEREAAKMATETKEIARDAQQVG